MCFSLDLIKKANKRTSVTLSKTACKNFSEASYTNVNMDQQIQEYNVAQPQQQQQQRRQGFSHHQQQGYDPTQASNIGQFQQQQQHVNNLNPRSVMATELMDLYEAMGDVIALQVRYKRTNKDFFLPLL